MAIEAPAETPIDELSEQELRALKYAAAWYVNYHGPIIAEQADDPSAAAVARREKFLALHAGLWKLGVRLALPGRLAAPARR